MNSLLSALSSELCIVDYEINIILSSKLFSPFIKVYFRYVGDTFILFRDTNRQVEVMVK